MAQPGNDEKHLELKVGAVIITAVVLLITFILLLSDFSFKSKQELTVYFQNPGGLSSGAAVKVAGRRAGTVREMTFIGQDGPINPLTKRPALVRAVLNIDEEIYRALRADAKFYITAKGMLGDPFLEITPGFSETPYNKEATIFGIDPPRLDLFMADTYMLVNGLSGIIERNADDLDAVIGGSARLIGTLDRALEADGGVEVAKVNDIFNNIDGLVSDTRRLVNGVQKRYVDDPGVARTLANMESLTRKLNSEIEPLLAEIKTALSGIERVTDTLGPEEQRRIKAAVAKLDDIASRTDKMIARGDAVMSRLERGEGTVGQLIQDEEIYDDLKELIRDIKRHPWKLIWED